ncbi:MAG: sigma-54-dependent Fis family transcriptional regulator [Planctomycetaceae bacterium]|nr:sigma-54-dependent Fis family transcriptional regulator [Planctomycetaceae bacterium]
MSKLLVVDDEQSICWGLSKLGESIGHDVAVASSAEEALEAVDEVRPDLIVLDVRLPGMDGLSAIEQFRQRVGQVPIIVITAYGDLETAVEAVRNGAFEYIVKPFDLDTVQHAVTRALSKCVAASESRTNSGAVGGLVGRSPAMQEVFKQIALAASAETSVLLCGESGTGKELAARALHRYSSRGEGPFVAVNVASLSSSLAESELFGHARGAFTGADHDRVGLLAQANGGTLFLDEVADIPMPAQVKLLRALDHGEVVPVGSSRSVMTDFRIVSASHQDLPMKVKNGEFRHDLYFRIAAFRIDLPPLRKRGDDIRELAEYFLAVASRDEIVSTVLSDEAVHELQQRPWYGNVRELRNAMEHAVIVARGGVIGIEHLPEAASASLIHTCNQDQPIDETISELIERWARAKLAGADVSGDLYEQLLKLVEPSFLKAAIEKHQGQYSSAARQLGLHRTTLRKKLDEYGLSSS